MPLEQAEAEALLNMPKTFVGPEPLEFRLTEHMRTASTLRSHDRREEFILDLERANRNRLALKYQTRARKVIVLARLEINGPRHRNPPGQPYRPEEWLPGTHLHLYREGFETRVAYLLAEAPGWNTPVNDGIVALEGFLRFCGVDPVPPIQTAI